MINVFQIKFFVLQDGDVIDGFQDIDTAKRFCDDMKKAYPRHRFTIFSVDAVSEDDKELELIRESFYHYQLALEEEWDR